MKKILPVPFLKGAFLIYNKIRIRTIDRIIFPEYHVAKNQFLVYRQGYPWIEAGISFDGLPQDEVRDYMLKWQGWSQEEFLLVLNKTCRIEPRYGWGIVNTSRLVYYSLGVSRTWFQPKPSLLHFLRRHNDMKLSIAISLRDTGEENYFHFFNDVLSKLFFIQQHNIDIRTIPVIISQKLWDKPYFQYYLKYSSFLQSLRWVRQDNQYIICETVIFCKPLTHRRDLWNLILKPLRKQHDGSDLKIFLTRHKSRLRFIENSDEIEAICLHHGFTVIDTDVLTPEQQVALFSRASAIIGIHGAGLTNMAFGHGPCKVLELFPPPTKELNYLAYHYIMLAGIKNFGYRGLIGENSERKFSGGFRISPDRFGNALKDFDSIR